MIEEALDSQSRSDKCLSQFGKRRLAYDNKQPDPMPHDRIAFIRPVTNTLIVGDSNPMAPAFSFQPDLIRSLRRKMISVAFNLESRRPEDIGEALSKVAIGEKCEIQAARS